MKFTKGDWTHTGFRDVFMEVVRIDVQNKKIAKMKVIWWNLGWIGKPFLIDIESIRIKDFNNWSKLTNRIRKI